MNILDQAKLLLLGKQNSTFISTVFLSLKTGFTDEVPTAAVNGISIFINPKFFEKLSKGQRVFLLAHEAWHVALNHTLRFKAIPEANHSLFNMAADYVINLMLVDAGYEFIPEGLLDSKYRNMSTEQVYKSLLDGPEEQKPNPDHMDLKESDTDSDELKNKLDEIICKAAIQAEQANQYGSLPEDLKRYHQSLVNPKLDWVTLLHNYVDTFSKEDYSYRKPNRRYIGQDMYLPSLYSESVGNITVFFDTSGSISQAELNLHLAEVSSIKEKLNPITTDIICFDTSIKTVQSFSQDEYLDSVEFTGGGGTFIPPVLDYIKEHEPNVTIIFTDGYFRYPQNIDINTPVLWVIYKNKNFTLPLGETIYYD